MSIFNSHSLIPYLDPSYNAWLMWGADPLLSGVLGFEPFSFSYRLLLAAILGSGIFAILRYDLQVKSIESWICTTATLLCAFSIAPHSPVVWGTIAWIPWLTRSFLALAQQRQPLWIFICLFLAVRLAKSALYLSPLAFGIVILLTTALGGTAILKRLPLKVGLGLAGIVIALFLFSLPSISALDYPAGATFVPDDGVPGTVRAFVGFDPPFETINLPAIYAHLIVPSVLVLIAAIASSALRLGSSAAALILSVIVLLDLLLPRSLALIAPLASISRLLPGAFLYPLHPLLLIACCMLLTMKAAGNRRSSLVGAILAFCLAAQISPSPEVSTNEWLARISNSPSRYVLKVFGPAQIEGLYRHREVAFQPLGAAIHSVQASSGQESISLLTDINPKTRWKAHPTSTLRDWLLLELRPDAHIAILRLSTGKYHSDFPRGLEVRGFASCPSGDDFSKGQTLLRFEDWPGNVNFTHSGLPFLVGQDNPTFYIGDKFHCIAIERIGRISNFDWSVAEIEGAMAQ